MPLGGLPWRALRSHENIDVTIQNVQQREQLIDRLARVRLIKQPIVLRGRCAKPPDHLTFGERTRFDPFLRLNGQFIQKGIAQVMRVLIVLNTCSL